MRPRLLGVGVAVVAVLAGCGDGSDVASVSTTVTSTGAGCGALPSAPEPGPDRVAVTVHYTCGDGTDGATVPVVRVVPATAGVLRASLDALVAGPTDAERDLGLTSWFSPATAGTVTSVDLDDDGAATVDFADLRPIIPNASASAGSRVLLSQLDATVFEHPSVRSVVYRIDGDCEAFTEWLQLGGCEPRVRT
jgi:spore germination protein GerM